jgi:hypothetical protein
MTVDKIGAQIVITDSSEYPGGGQEFDVTSMHARMKVTTTRTTITDLANSTFKWSCDNGDFVGGGVPIITQQLIKEYLYPIIGS